MQGTRVKIPISSGPQAAHALFYDSVMIIMAGLQEQFQSVNFPQKLYVNMIRNAMFSLGQSLLTMD